MDTKEMPATKAVDTTAPYRVPEDICAFVITKASLTEEEIVLAHIVMCSLLLHKNKEYTQDPSDFFLKGSVQHK